MINLVPETYSVPPSARRRYIWRSTAAVAVMLAAFIVFYAVGGGATERPGLNLFMAGLWTAFLLFAVYETVALIRSLDELQQRIHILSWAISLAAALLVGFIWSFAHAVLPIARFEPAFAALVAMPAYYISLFLVSRHYR